MFRRIVATRSGAVAAHQQRSLLAATRFFSGGDASAPSSPRAPSPLAPSPKKGFRAPSADASAAGAGGGGEANPYKSWEHLSHNWMLLMCVGALAAGVAAGRFAEVDETKLNVAKFEKETIVREMRKNFEVRPDLAATILRVAFVLAARRAGVQAESVDESCAVVDGLADVASIMQFTLIGSNCSMEDMVSLAAVEAIRFLHGPYAAIEWQWGRQDLDKPKPRLERRADAKPLEEAKGLLSTPREYKDERSPMLPFEVIFKAIDATFTEAEITALMGTHSVGETHDHVTGLGEYQRSPTRFELDNMYYKVLLAAEKRTSPLHVGRFKENEDVRFLPHDLLTATVKPSEVQGARKKTKRAVKCAYARSEVAAMLGDKRYRQWVVKYADDEALWATNFQSAWQKLINSNVTGKLRPYVSPTAVKEEARGEEAELPK